LGIQPTYNKNTTQENEGISSQASQAKMMTKKEEAALERRRVSLEKIEKKMILSDIAAKRKAQISAIVQDGLCASGQD
jgi:hypothetical protein